MQVDKCDFLHSDHILSLRGAHWEPPVWDRSPSISSRLSDHVGASLLSPSPTGQFCIPPACAGSSEKTLHSPPGAAAHGESTSTVPTSFSGASIARSSTARHGEGVAAACRLYPPCRAVPSRATPCCAALSRATLCHAVLLPTVPCRGQPLGAGCRSCPATRACLPAAPAIPAMRER